MQVVLIGLGRMGANMARRWARGGVNVVAFDQSEEARAAATEIFSITSPPANMPATQWCLSATMTARCRRSVTAAR